MAFGTPPFAGHVGGQNEISMMGVVGTLGTADTSGTAQILPVGVDPTTGAMFVNNLGASGGGGNPTSGTLSTLGTVGTILGIGGTVTVSGASAGTFVNIATGTQQTLGTVNIIQNAGTIQGGTINNVATGTINALASGTITGGTLQNLVSGTINALASGTITGGTINNIGSVVGLGGTAIVKNDQTAGVSGTWTSATSQNTAVTQSVVNYPTAAVMINQTAGVSGGAITFEVSDPAGNWYPVEMMATNGAQTVVTYSLQSSTNVAFQMNVAGFTNFRARLSTAITGTATVIVTTVANASAAEWASFITGGTSTVGSVIGVGGTVLTNPVAGTQNTLGTVGVVNNIVTGTLANSGTTTGVGVVSNLTNGSVNILTGTIQNSGTTTGVGVVTNLTNGSVIIQSGTLTAGTLPVVTTVSNLTNGSVNILSGTLLNTGTNVNIVTGSQQTLGTVGVVNFGTIAISDGTNTANVINSGVSNGTGGQHALITVGGLSEMTGSVSAGTTDAIASFDSGNYTWISVQSSGTFVGTINVQESNDNVNFTNASSIDYSSSGNTFSSPGNITTNTISILPIYARFVRVRMMAYTSGTAIITAELKSIPAPYITMGVSLAAGGANIGKISQGSIQVTAGTIVSNGGTVGVAYSSFNFISAAATTTVKATPGVLHTLAGTFTGNGTLYNSAGTSTSVIWGGVIGAAPLYFDVAFGSLTFAGTGAASLTVIYT